VLDIIGWHPFNNLGTVIALPLFVTRDGKRQKEKPRESLKLKRFRPFYLDKQAAVASG